MAIIADPGCRKSKEVTDPSLCVNLCHGVPRPPTIEDTARQLLAHYLEPPRSGRQRAAGATRAAPAVQVAQFHRAAARAAPDHEFIAAGERKQQEPRVFERDAGRRMQFQVGLVCLAQQVAGFQRSETVSGLDATRAALEQAVHQVQSGELSGLEVQFRIAEKERHATRRFAAMPEHRGDPVAGHVAAIQLGVLFKLHGIQQCTRSYPANPRQLS